MRRTLRSRLTHDRVMRCGMTLLVVTITFALAACSGSTSASTAPTATATPPTAATALPPVPRRLASSDPVQLADDLVADEQALCDPKSSEAVLMGAAGRQQAAYRALGRHPEWDVIARPRIPPSLLERLRPQRRHATAVHCDSRERTEGHAARVAHRPAGADQQAARLLPRSRGGDRRRLELPCGDQLNRNRPGPRRRRERRRRARPHAVPTLDVR